MCTECHYIFNYLHFQSSSSTSKYYNAAYIERPCFTCYADRWRLERRYGILELQPVFIDSSFIDSTINLQVMNLNTSQMEWVADSAGSIPDFLRYRSIPKL